jgi:hypothetical protein
MNETYPNPYLSGSYEVRLNTVLTTSFYLGGTDLRGGNQAQGEGQQFNEDDPSSGLSDNELELMQVYICIHVYLFIYIYICKYVYMPIHVLYSRI